jgi:outer membrane protein assembly factor BamD (BamD/ComL family)
MSVTRFSRLICALLLVAQGACRSSFQPDKFRSDEALYRASLAQFSQQRWDNAASGFQRLTLQLPARDPLMPRVLYFLGRAHANDGQHLLAAQSFSRLAQSFPEDTLADDALLAAGKAYARLWRKPTLDPQYGEDAMSTLRTLQAMYPNSPLLP